MKSDDPITCITMLGTLPPIRALSSYCFEFSRALSTRFPIEFISFKSIYPAFLYPGGNLEDDHTFPDITNPAIHVRRRLSWYKPLSWIIEGACAKGELLHAQWWSLPLFPIYLTICLCFKLRGKPVVFTVHNVLSHDKSRLYKKLSSMLFQFGDHFIVHSAQGRQQMIDHYHIRPEDVSVIAHGRLDFQVKKDIDRYKLRQEMGFDRKDKIILLFGAIRPYKGVETAIRAFSQIVKIVPEARLLIAGKLWEDWAPYEKLIQQLGMTDYIRLHLEYIPSGQVHKYFEISDLTIFPYSRFDSQSGVATTAVAFHKPMVVTNVGGLPELATDPEWVVEPDNPEALAKTVIKFLKDPNMPEQMKLKMEAISRQLDWTDIARKVTMVYKATIGKRGEAGSC